GRHLVVRRAAKLADRRKTVAADAVQPLAVAELAERDGTLRVEGRNSVHAVGILDRELETLEDERLLVIAERQPHLVEVEPGLEDDRKADELAPDSERTPNLDADIG